MLGPLYVVLFATNAAAAAAQHSRFLLYRITQIGPIRSWSLSVRPLRRQRRQWQHGRRARARPSSKVRKSSSSSFTHSHRSGQNERGRGRALERDITAAVTCLCEITFMLFTVGSLRVRTLRSRATESCSKYFPRPLISRGCSDRAMRFQQTCYDGDVAALKIHENNITLACFSRVVTSFSAPVLSVNMHVRATYPTPCFILDKNGMAQQLNNIRSSFLEKRLTRDLRDQNGKALGKQSGTKAGSAIPPPDPSSQ